jgi:hypothetical protein
MAEVEVLFDQEPISAGLFAQNFFMLNDSFFKLHSHGKVLLPLIKVSQSFKVGPAGLKQFALLIEHMNFGKRIEVVQNSRANKFNDCF